VQQPSEEAIEAVKQIRESLLHLERMSKDQDYQMLAYLLRLCIIESDEIVGDTCSPNDVSYRSNS
jgi:hypothetical protein